MDRIKIQGGRPLKGLVKASGSKNAVLPLLFSSLLAKGEHIFENTPALEDVNTSCRLLEHLGCLVQKKGQVLRVHNPGSLKSVLAPYNLVRRMRAGILSLGPLLAAQGSAKVSLPGGCAIGTRAVDLHLKGLEQMGAEISLKEGYIIGRVKNKKLKGADISLDFPTVGGTENLMLAACLAEGPSVIKNAACEPEIKDLAKYLQSMGARIEGAGQDIIKVQPAELKASRHKLIPDRIEAGTLLLAGAITKGNVTVEDCVPEHLEALIVKLKEAGFFMETTKNSIALSSPNEFSAVDITTAPYPGFPTDLQAQFMALLTQARPGGKGLVTETIFENRFMHIQELVRLGARVKLDGRRALVQAGTPLQGAPVLATDLRASACLILAGLAAKGLTWINRIYHLDRGYEKLENKLNQLGAEIERVV